MKKTFLLILFLFFINFIHAQNWIKSQSKEDVIKQYIEFLSANLESEDLDINDILDDLEFYYEHPLSINTASYEELRKLIFLNDFQIANILTHRAMYGPFLSIYELQVLEGFDIQSLQWITPFITVQEKFTINDSFFKSALNNSSHEFFLQSNRTLELSNGYLPKEDGTTAYLGSPYRVTSRYRFKSNNFRAVFNAEKDPGEQLFTGTQKRGFDFYSGHIYYENKTFLRKLILGDYHMEFGQGLSFWTSRAFSKTQDIFMVKKNPRGISPYNSLMESNFLRGGAIEIGNEKFQTTFFYSDRLLDGSIQQADSIEDESDLIFTSINISGYHRTLNELVKKNSISEQILGISPTIRIQKFKISGIAVQRLRNATFDRSIKLYNQFFPDTSKNSLQMGLSYDYLLKNILIFGEVSKNITGAPAFLNGLIASLGKTTSISLVHRNYPRDFNFIYNNAFRESYASNEKGLYIGINHQFNRKWKLDIYADRFQFSWLTYYISSPSFGTDYFAQLNYIPKKRSLVYIRVRAEQKNRDNKEYTITKVSPYNRYFIRFHYETELTKQLSLESRIEWNKTLIQNNTEFGYLIYQDVSYRIRYFKIIGRIALFDTDSYNSRIYAFENNLKYQFFIPAFYDKGYRWYLLSEYNTKFGIKFQSKVSQTFFSNRANIGSGNDLIEGNKRTDVSVAVILSFK